METPRLFTTLEDIERIRGYIARYSWYNDSFMQLKAQADEMLTRGFSVPREKGYVFYTHCPIDNVKLIFDPYNRAEHRCPVCGMNFLDKPYQGAWLCSYHHWLAQMAIHLGIVFLISGEERYARGVREILLGYVQHYPGYPNDDNELGPTKCFQSTYMESVWLVNLVGAYDMISHSTLLSGEERRQIKETLFLPSAYVIYDYNEGKNNRQAFNNVALCAVGLIAQEERLFEEALYGEYGFFYHMENCVLPDGMWYEGDNYHFATLPSMVNIAEMCRNNGLDLYNRTFRGNCIEGLFRAPLCSLQPDLTFPSRKDSQYGTLIAQRWYAGLYELAYTRTENPQFGKILKVIYQQQEGEGTLANAAGVMDIFPSQRASRSSLDWRGFLCATPILCEESGLPFNESVRMEGTGLVVLRGAEGQYVSLDYGHYGGGHGHPDRLQLSFFIRGRRWLTDYGTGQYYFDHLHWYRSSLCHNTVIVDGRSHLPVEGACVLLENTPQYTITSCVVEGLYPGVDMQRTVLLFSDGVLVDLTQLQSQQQHSYQYALHCSGTLTLPGLVGTEHTLSGANYRFLNNTLRYTAQGALLAEFSLPQAALQIHTLGQPGTVLYTATAYGPPTQITRQFPLYLIERTGKNQTFFCVLEDVPTGAQAHVAQVQPIEGGLFLKKGDGTDWEITKGQEGFLVRCVQEGISARHTLRPVAKTPTAAKEMTQSGTCQRPYVKAEPLSMEQFSAESLPPWNLLMERPEQVARAQNHWAGPDDLSARGVIATALEALLLVLEVRDNTPNFTGGKFPYDNDSVQLYFDRREAPTAFDSSKAAGIYGLLVLPEQADECTHLQSIGGENIDTSAIAATTRVTEGGYRLRLRIPFESIGGPLQKGAQIGLGIAINDRDHGIRRDKQLYWGDALPNERIYLREDLLSPGHFGVLELG